MSHFSIIRDASVQLRRHLFDALTSVSDVDFGFTNVINDIILEPPDSSIPESARLSIYLYHIEPDPHLRNQRELSVGATGLVRAPMAIRLNYLITPLLDAEDRNQLMLGRIIQALHDTPMISRIGAEALDDSRGGGSPELRIGFEDLDLESLSRIWHALGSDYRLSVGYTVRVAMIDSALGVEEAHRVADAHLVVETKD